MSAKILAEGGYVPYPTVPTPLMELELCVWVYVRSLR